MVNKIFIIIYNKLNLIVFRKNRRLVEIIGVGWESW